MTDIHIFLGIILGIGLVTGCFYTVASVLELWLNNDGCRHKWPMWETSRDIGHQIRFCTKCNMAQKREI